MISEAILIPKIYARLQEIFQNFPGRPPAGARAFGAWFGALPLYRAPFSKIPGSAPASCSAERVMSHVKIIKNRLRSAMLDDWFSALTIFWA